MAGHKGPVLRLNGGAAGGMAEAAAKLRWRETSGSARPVAMELRRWLGGLSQGQRRGGARDWRSRRAIGIGKTRATSHGKTMSMAAHPTRVNLQSTIRKREHRTRPLRIPTDRSSPSTRPSSERPIVSHRLDTSRYPPPAKKRLAHLLIQLGIRVCTNLYQLITGETVSIRDKKRMKNEFSILT